LAHHIKTTNHVLRNSSCKNPSPHSHTKEEEKAKKLQNNKDPKKAHDEVGKPNK
jgi:hypothetical protein